jgi:hypothetical protein
VTSRPDTSLNIISTRSIQCIRRVQISPFLVFGLSLHRHPSICILFISRFPLVLNKPILFLQTHQFRFRNLTWTLPLPLCDVFTERIYDITYHISSSPYYSEDIYKSGQDFVLIKTKSIETNIDTNTRVNLCLRVYHTP